MGGRSISTSKGEGEEAKESKGKKQGESECETSSPFPLQDHMHFRPLPILGTHTSVPFINSVSERLREVELALSICRKKR